MSSRLRDTITLDSILDEVEQVRALALALNENDYKTALNCTLSKAKLMGGGREMEQREKRNKDPVLKELLGDW